MKKVVRLTESELTNLIKKVVVESKKNTNKKRINEMENFINPEAMETADAIYTIIGTTIGLLGIAGYDYLKSMAQELMNQGKEKKAQKILDFVEKNAPNSEGKNDGGEMEEEWGSKKREYKRMGGKKMGDVDGHYKDYEVNESIIRRRTKRK
jgi:hypothetical protein